MTGRRHSQFKKILIGYDGSAQSDKPTESALALAQTLDAKLTSQLERRFETYAERYGAQAERSLGGARLKPEELSAIEENLRVLRAPQTFDFVEADSKRGPQNHSREIVRDIARHAHKGELR
jgi:nucleotide-binding universal stress UspA family protein